MPTEADLNKIPEKGKVNNSGWVSRPASLMKTHLNWVFLKMRGNLQTYLENSLITSK